MPDELKAKFSKSVDIKLHIKREYEKAMTFGQHSKVVIQKSIDQHVVMCVENADDLWDGLDLAKDLKDDIQDRIKHYSYCTIKTTKNYLVWLEEDYYRRLNSKIRQEFAKID